MVQVKSALNLQLAGLASGKRIPGSAVKADAALLSAAARAVRACRPTTTRSVGAPQAVVAALDRLAAETAALRTLSPATVGAKLQSIADQLDVVVKGSFPVVLGMPYGALLDRVIVEDSAI